MDEALLRATQGKTASQGGLNIKQFRERLVKCYPRKEKKICECRARGELEAYCKRDRNINAAIKRASKSYAPRGAGRRAGRKAGRRVSRRTDASSYGPRGAGRRAGRKVARRSQSPDSPSDEESSDCGCSMGPESPRRKDYFKPNVPLSERQQAYCRCVAHVAAKNPMSCYRGKSPEWKKGRDSENCVNPYSVCAASVGTTSKCYNYYNFRKIPTQEKQALKRLHGK